MSLYITVRLLLTHRMKDTEENTEPKRKRLSSYGLASPEPSLYPRKEKKRKESEEKERVVLSG